VGEWKHEPIFIKRDENGVIVGISELTPEGYEEPAEDSEEE
jgi:hypothetical protein